MIDGEEDETQGEGKGTMSSRTQARNRRVVRGRHRNIFTDKRVWVCLGVVIVVIVALILHPWSRGGGDDGDETRAAVLTDIADTADRLDVEDAVKVTYTLPADLPGGGKVTGSADHRGRFTGVRTLDDGSEIQVVSTGADVFALGNRGGWPATSRGG
jgi:hypothetical protein